MGRNPRARRRRGIARYAWAAGIVLLIAVVAATSDAPTTRDAAERDPEVLARGEQLYSATCAGCHGVDLEGTDTGPPFISPIYAPNHHSDEAFQRAAALGVVPHHWGFGAMPAQPTVSRADVSAIVAFVRFRQEQAGVFSDPTHATTP